MNRQLKHIFYRCNTLVLVALGLLINSCSTDFDVTTDWEETTIVYGLLDQSKSTQYIRVGKAFLDKEKGALELARIGDSLIFKPENIQVYLKAVKGRNDTLSYLLNTDNSIPKDSGIFAYPSQLLYKFEEPIDEERLYYLEITTPLGKEVRSVSPIVEDFFLLRPLSRQKLNLSSSLGTEILFDVPESGSIHEMVLRGHYEEYRSSDSVLISRKWEDLKLYENGRFRGVNNELYKTQFVGSSFADAFGRKLVADPSVIRRFLGIEFIVSVGSEELSNYIRVNSASNSIVQVKPEYSNVENGLGIFASRITLPVTDTLQNNPDYPYNSLHFREVLLPEGLDSLRAWYPELNFLNR